MALAPGSRFATTRWSLVLAASSPRSGEALEDLCRSYWFPLYGWARRSGRSPDEAQDLVQGFFAHLLEKKSLEAADPQRGRFRSFLLTSFKNWISHEREKERAQKRGGGRAALRLDGDPEGRLEPVSKEASPERQFDREWALAVLDRVLARLQTSYDARNQGVLFRALKGFLVQTDERTYKEAGAAAGLTESAVKVAVHRLRERYRRALHEEIAETVEPSQVDDEIRDLFLALSS